MAMEPNQSEQMAELAELPASDAELLAWIAEHPEFAADLAAARRVHTLVRALRAAEYTVPDGFEIRVLALVQQDAALASLIDLGTNGVGTLLLELITLLFGLTPRAAAPSVS